MAFSPFFGPPNKANESINDSNLAVEFQIHDPRSNGFSVAFPQTLQNYRVRMLIAYRAPEQCLT
jgi:hypothetical protein